MAALSATSMAAAMMTVMNLYEVVPNRATICEQFKAGLHGDEAQITCRGPNGHIVAVLSIIPEVAAILPGCFDGALEDLGQGVGSHAGETSSDDAAQMDQGSALAGHKACCNASDDANEFADKGPHAQESCKAQCI